jgi:hypothetical protein
MMGSLNRCPRERREQMRKARIAARVLRGCEASSAYSAAFTISSITFFASPNTIIVLSM